MVNFIQVNANPAAPSFSQNGDTLTSSPASAYQWYFNGVPISGATSQQFVATLSGNYSVSITDGKGCSSTSPSRYVALVGIDELNAPVLFYVFPNPTIEEINVMVQTDKTQNQ